jgi:hypothetical protein
MACLNDVRCIRIACARLADVGHVMRQVVKSQFQSRMRTKTIGLPLAMSVTIRPARVRDLHLVSTGTRIMT